MARLLILINPFKKKTVRYFEILLFYYITPSAAGAPGEKSESNQVPLLLFFLFDNYTSANVLQLSFSMFIFHY